jgi:hypothetical protein
LHRRIVLEQGLATSVSTQNDARVEHGVFWVFAECAQGAEPAALEKAIDEQIARLRDEPVPAAQLARAKRMLVAGEAYESETVSDLAEELGEFAVDAHWSLALENLQRIRDTDARTIQDCARRLLVTERRVVGWSLPREGAQTKPRSKSRRNERRPKASTTSSAGTTSKPARRSKAGAPRKARAAAKAARAATGKLTLKTKSKTARAAKRATGRKPAPSRKAAQSQSQRSASKARTRTTSARAPARKKASAPRTRRSSPTRKKGGKKS